MNRILGTMRATGIATAVPVSEGTHELRPYNNSAVAAVYENGAWKSVAVDVTDQWEFDTTGVFRQSPRADEPVIREG